MLPPFLFRLSNLQAFACTGFALFGSLEGAICAQLIRIGVGMGLVVLGVAAIVVAVDLDSMEVNRDNSLCTRSKSSSLKMTALFGFRPHAPYNHHEQPEQVLAPTLTA